MISTRCACALLVAGLLAPAMPSAQPCVIQGPATPVSGIGIRLAGETVDLFGITLPDAAMDALERLGAATRAPASDSEVVSPTVVPTSDAAAAAAP